MPDYRAIYLQQAEDYERLVRREDYRHQLEQALAEVQPANDLDVIELGAGTGRLTLMLAPLARSIVMSDVSRPMLEVAIGQLRRSNLGNWRALVADNRELPLPDRSADLSIAGWSLGHTCAWQPTSWRHEIDRAITQLLRVLRPNGVAIIFETLGTGYEAPHIPTEALAEYYTRLEQQHGFKAKWLRTDYQFESPAEAEELTRFFFGDELADRVARQNLTILPECTGLWWKRNPD
jgi:ubiquinone/menaquinone biosynthesis C-methylase UbiE